MKPTIVEFSNGKFGVQVGRWPAKFADLTSPRYSWGLRTKCIDDCMGCKADAEKVLSTLNLTWKKASNG